MMTRRFKLVIIALIVVLLALSVTCMGMTLAIWTSSTGGSETVAPATDSPFDWNAWAKYFDGEIINEDLGTAILTSFHGVDDGNSYGLNLETVVIPELIEIGGKEYHVTEIGNQVFADATLKQLPVTVYISPSVTRIDAMAFANLPNLTTVIFGLDSNGNGQTCTVDDFSFMMSASLATVVTNGRTVNGADGQAIVKNGMAFLGCSSGLQIVESL